MSSAGGSSASSSRRSRPGRSRVPSHVLLNVDAVVGIHRNRTTARALNRNGVLIEVSFLLKRPPQPSILYVDSDELNPCIGPVILCSVDGLLLLRVNFGREERQWSLKLYCDYYVYRAAAAANGGSPSLDLLERPPSRFFRGNDVSLLPRPDGRYTVAALLDIGRDDAYELQLCHSDTRTWTTRQVFVQPPQWDPLPKRGPKSCEARLLRHYTSSVVTIGGDGGTMAWVDLWRSILLCDVLRPDPSLRGVPVPLPPTMISLIDGLEVKIEFPEHGRGISFNRDKGCFTLVHLERHESPPPIEAAKRRGLHGQDVQVLDWELTTWSNSKMSDSLEDWHQERSVRASNITIADPVAVSQMMEDFRLLRRPPPQREHNDDDEAATAAPAAAQAQQQLQLHNLSICQPALCPNGKDDVVYLVAREKYRHPKAWLLAVDMKNQGKLKHVAKIGDLDNPFRRRIYFLSRISKYTNPKTRLIKTVSEGEKELKDRQAEMKKLSAKLLQMRPQTRLLLKMSDALLCGDKVVNLCVPRCSGPS